MNFYFDLVKQFFSKYFVKLFMILISLSILDISIYHTFFQTNLKSINDATKYDVALANNDLEISSKDNNLMQNTENSLEETANEEKYYVDVKGAVKNPGVYEVSTNSIVNDCLKLAGGLLKTADTTTINLSKKVSLEMVIYVPKKDEVVKSTTNTTVTKNQEIPNNAAIPDKDTTTASSDAKTDNDTNVLININTATKDELTTLTGIGAAKAQDIIDYRTNNGNFKTIEDLKNVSGIGEALYAKIKDNITV